MEWFSRLGVALTALAFVALASAALVSVDADGEVTIAVRAQAVGDPVAIIAPLPDEVSNGTWWNLDGSDSSDDGFITNYTWAVTVGDATTYVWGQAESFKFRTLGLYEITLTVTDNENKTAQAFTAVYSIIDSDKDGLPDWWEMSYLYKLDFTGSDDNDGDKYTNLQEYASGTSPIEKDPQPGLVKYLTDNWMYLAVIAAAIVGVVLAIRPRMKRKRKREEKKKIEAALEIERALEAEK